MNTKTIFLTFVFLFSFSFPLLAKNDPEESHVQVVLVNGDTISGYMRSDLKTGLKNMFSKTGSIRQYINIGEEPSGGDTQRYSASEVKEYRFTETTEAFPEGKVVVAEQINSPIMFKPLNTVHGFAVELDRRDSGSILRWDVWESTGGRNSTSRLVPAVGVKFKGSGAAYPFMMNGRIYAFQLMHYLKKKHPDLHKVIDEYYNKGKDAKAHRKELTDNPSSILAVYEEYLEDHSPIDDSSK